MAKTGAARVFFDIVGRFQSTRLLADSKSALIVQQAIVLDALGAVQDGFNEMTTAVLGYVDDTVNAFFEYEQQLVRVRKFYGDSSEVEQFAEKAREMGLAFAYTGSEALKAAARTAQLKGVLKSQEAVIEATKQGLLLAQIGEMETELGMNRFINLAQQTGFMYGGLTKARYEAMDAEIQANIVRESSIHTLNQLNTIENSSVATMEDITFVLNQFASQASIAGESIGEMAAMSALLLETGEEVSRAGTGLRMIYQRLGNANNEATKAIAELIPGMDAQGVASIKLSEVINKLAPSYAAMTAEEKRSLAVSVAGSRHYIKFLKIMENQTRLQELNTAAFKSQYGAIDEFNNKAESAVFMSQQMEASLENMRAKIGEDLTDAFMSAYYAEELFLKATGGILALPGVGGLVGSLVNLANNYEKLYSPLSNAFFNTMNLVIAMKTLRAVTASTSAEMAERVRSYQETQLIMNLQEGLENKLIHTGEKHLALMNRQQQSRVTLQGLENKALGAVLKEENAIVKNTVAQIKSNQAKLDGMKKTKKNEEARKSLIVTISKGTVALRRQKEAQTEARSALGLGVAAMQKEKQIMTITTSQKANRIAMEKRSIETVYKQVESQQSYNDILRTQARLMQEEIVLYSRLDTATKEGLVTRNSDLAMRQREEQDILAALNLIKAEQLAKKQSTVATEEDIITARENISVMSEERMQIQQLINADKVLETTTRKTTSSVKSFNLVVKESAVALLQSGAALKTLQMSMMGVTMLLPIVVDDTQQMSAMMYGMSLTIVSMAIPALLSINVALIDVGIAAGFASGGLTVLLAGAAMLAAYAGFQLFDDAFGDNLKSTLLDVQALNEDLNSTVAILSDLSGAAGGAEVMGSMGLTYDDLKTSAELTLETMDSLSGRISTLQSEIDTASIAGDSDLAAGLTTQLNLYETTLTKVQAIDEAQKLANRSATDMSNTFASISSEHTGADNVGTFFDLGEMAYAILGRGDLYDEYTVQGKVNGEAFTQGFGIGAEGQEAAEQFIQDFNAQYNTSDESMDFMNQYYQDLLAVQSNVNSEFIDGEIALYNTLTDAQDSFANSREELFFGNNKGNFTGALYKQVVQGGVESLLHKTEIVQNNIFNGYNTEQMVDRVTGGVLDELRAQGVIS